MTLTASDDNPESAAEPIHEPRLWRDNGWTAKVVKNNDDDGWAVEMIKAGEPEPALVGPWTMGRDKRNPKPLDTGAFNTLVKTASEFVRRHEQQLHALLHKSVVVKTTEGRITVTLDIVRGDDNNDDDAHAMLAAHDADAALLCRVRVAPNFRLTPDSAAAWIAGGYARP